EHGAPENVQVISNPEFLREGTAVGDFLHPDRVVIGADTEQAGKKLAEVYKPQIDEGVPFLFTTPESAELVKYASNAFLALKLTFINEIALLADKIGVDTHDVAKGMGMDKRIGAKFLLPGPGYGGSCLPKDTNGLIHIARSFGAELMLVETAVRTNERIPIELIGRLAEAVGGLRGKAVGVLGLAFKGGTDDVRESPAIKLIGELTRQGAVVRAFDPQAEKLARRELGDTIEYAATAENAIAGADVLVVATEWPQFGEIPPKEIARLMRGRTLADFRNLFDPREAESAGLQYLGMGRA
ncbi:MAG TPA: UDP-glucose/GDP-mannose dehydrogenase family protein, partial [candidate division Zixibacteria bacterium]|nr:UDP-glucose/GDP-mannose dehydrogenase family protein [candidate division Zixibacteria bacterium]